MATPNPSDPTAPITPARFAAALKDLSIASLHLKVLELRNALLHLAYSNDQLRPFADGTATALNLAPGEPDPDCADAIRENEAVMARMRERIELVKVEVVGRGVSWREFDDQVPDDNEPGVTAAAAPEARSWPSFTNGSRASDDDDDTAASATTNHINNNTDSTASASTATTTTSNNNPWTDGTFQMGTIRGGVLHMDGEPPQRPNGVGSASVNGNSTSTTAAAAAASSTAPQAGSGGRLTDEELRRLLEMRLAEDADDDDDGDGGLHL